MTTNQMKRWWALAAVCLSVLAVSLDGTILAVALPTLAGELHASQSELVWFSAGYLLVLAVAVLPVGLLGDRIGRKKVTLASLILFGIGSVVCAYANSAGVFLAGRVLQGLAGAGITVMAMSALIVLFDDEERPRAVGFYQAVSFIALPLGPILGGWMLSHMWWGWIFLINVPIVIAAVVVCAMLIPESRASERPGLDPLGTIMSASGVALFVFGLVQAGEDGWTPMVLASIISGMVVLTGFVMWERRLGARPGGKPLIPPALFVSQSFIWGAILAGTAGLPMIGVLFTMPQYFQGVQEVDTLGSGLRLLPLIAGMVVGAGLASKIAQAAGSGLTVASGFIILAAGLALGATTEVGSSVTFVSIWMAVVGLGTGLALAAATAAALAGLSKERSGIESAVVQAFNKTAAPLGTAIMGSVVVAIYQDRLDLAGIPVTAIETAQRSLFEALVVAQELDSTTLADAARYAFVDGMQVALWLSGAIAVIGAAAAAIFLRGRRPLGAVKSIDIEETEDDTIGGEESEAGTART